MYHENRENNKETFQHLTLNHSNKTKSEREAESFLTVSFNFLLLTHNNNNNESPFLLRLWVLI